MSDPIAEFLRDHANETLTVSEISSILAYAGVEYKLHTGKPGISAFYQIAYESGVVTGWEVVTGFTGNLLADFLGY